MVAVKRIVFNDMGSNDFDLICELAFDSDNGESSTFLSREAVASENYRGDFKRVQRYKYTETMSPTFTFVKKDFSDFTFEEQRRVLRWLTSNQTPSFLSVYYDDSEDITYELLGAFTEVNTYKLANNRTVGITAVFESVFPYALSSLRSVVKDVSNPDDSTFTIDVQTDEPETLIYSKITIQQNNTTIVVETDHVYDDTETWIEGTVYHSGDIYFWVDWSQEEAKQKQSSNTSGIETTSVSITNTFTDLQGVMQAINTVVKKNTLGERIVLDGANKVISSSRPLGRTFGDDFNFNWIPLIGGTNIIKIVGNCVVTIEWREPIKCGEF